MIFPYGMDLLIPEWIHGKFRAAKNIGALENNGEPQRHRTAPHRRFPDKGGVPRGMQDDKSGWCERAKPFEKCEKIVELDH